MRSAIFVNLGLDFYEFVLENLTKIISSSDLLLLYSFYFILLRVNNKMSQDYSKFVTFFIDKFNSIIKIPSFII